MNGDFVAGVDGCRAGWIIAIRPLGTPVPLRIELVETFAEVLARAPEPAVIAVDIPIGFPEKSGIGGRAADVEARRCLGGRQSAVFAVPSRRAVMTADYREACAVAFDTSDPPRKVSKQIFHLFPKMREVDELMAEGTQHRVFEVHPEVAFWVLNGERPLEQPKKVKSRPYPPGLGLRRDLLASVGYDLARIDAFKFLAKDAGPDDILDAVANSWTASRIARGEAHRFPSDPPRDERGLRMEIWG